MDGVGGCPPKNQAVSHGLRPQRRKGACPRTQTWNPAVAGSLTPVQAPVGVAAEGYKLARRPASDENVEFNGFLALLRNQWGIPPDQCWSSLFVRFNVGVRGRRVNIANARDTRKTKNGRKAMETHSPPGNYYRVAALACRVAMSNVRILTCPVSSDRSEPSNALGAMKTRGNLRDGGKPTPRLLSRGCSHTIPRGTQGPDHLTTHLWTRKHSGTSQPLPLPVDARHSWTRTACPRNP